MSGSGFASRAEMCPRHSESGTSRARECRRSSRNLTRRAIVAETIGVSTSFPGAPLARCAGDRGLKDWSWGCTRASPPAPSWSSSIPHLPRPRRAGSPPEGHPARELARRIKGLDLPRVLRGGGDGGARPRAPVALRLRQRSRSAQARHVRPSLRHRASRRSRCRRGGALVVRSRRSVAARAPLRRRGRRRDRAVGLGLIPLSGPVARRLATGDVRGAQRRLLAVLADPRGSASRPPSSTRGGARERRRHARPRDLRGTVRVPRGARHASGCPARRRQRVRPPEPPAGLRGGRGPARGVRGARGGVAAARLARARGPAGHGGAPAVAATGVDLVARVAAAGPASGLHRRGDGGASHRRRDSRGGCHGAAPVAHDRSPP